MPTLGPHQRIIQDTDVAIVIVDFQEIFSMILKAEKNVSRKCRDGALTVISKKGKPKGK